VGVNRFVISFLTACHRTTPPPKCSGGLEVPSSNLGAPIEEGPGNRPFLSPEEKRNADQTETLMGNVASQTAVPTKTATPTTRSATRGPVVRSFVLMPAKNNDAANKTTPST
jgi:hypothetical protein